MEGLGLGLGLGLGGAQEGQTHGDIWKDQRCTHSNILHAQVCDFARFMHTNLSVCQLTHWS